MKEILKKIKKLNTRDVIIPLMIIALPFLFYSYLLVPKVKTWNTILFTVNSNDYIDVHVLIWLINTKLLLIIGLLIWFVTGKRWWKNAILIPLIIELFKLFSVISANKFYVDNDEFIRSLPLTIPIIIMLYYIFSKMHFYTCQKKLRAEINFEIDDLIKELFKDKKEELSEIDLIFKEAKRKKNEISNEEYLSLLISIRNKIFEK